ncbi:MAG: hypothetical protein WBP82_09175 [Leuconostoc mesenteroides]
MKQQAKTIQAKSNSNDYKGVIVKIGQKRFIPFVEWTEQNFYKETTVIKFGKEWDFSNAELVELGEAQKRICTHVLTPRPDGRFPYRTVFYSTIKKEGKTTLAGMVGAWWAACIEPPNLILTLANDQEQSAGRIFGAMTPTLAGLGCKVPTAISSKPEVRIPNGTVVQAITNNYAGQAGANYGLTLWCLDQETEVLTNNGWRKYDTIEVNDLIATRSKEGFLEYEKANDCFISKYAGNMVRLNHRRADFLVTPNHRVFGKFWTNGRYKSAQEWTTLEAKDLPAFGKICASSDWQGTEHHEIELEGLDRKLDADAWFEFLGYYISEGCVNWSYNSKKEKIVYGANISQCIEKNPETYAKIVNCIKRLGFKLSLSKVSINIQDRSLGKFVSKLGKSHEKHIPKQMMFASKRQLLLLFNAYMEGDGSKPAGNCKDYFQCGTVSKQLKDDLMDIGLKCGYIPRLIQIRTVSASTKRPYYRLSFSTCTIEYDKKIALSQENYDGIVWCPSTNNGIIYIRRNGKCCYSGNSELWAYNSERSRKLYDELVPVLTKLNSLRWVETYVGFEDESELMLHQFLRIFTDTSENSLQPGVEVVPELADITSDGKPTCYHIPSEGLFYFHNHTPMMPWSVGEEAEKYRRQQKAELRPAQYTRLWENRWQSAEGTFIKAEEYDDAITQDGPSYEPMILAGDASMRNDTIFLIGIKKYIAKLFGQQTERYKLCYVGYWSPKDVGLKRKTILGGKKGDIDLDETIAREVKNLWNRGLITGPFWFDPYQLHQVAINLRKKGIPCVEFGQNNERLLADTFLGETLRKGELDLFHHPILEVQLKGAKVKEYENQQVRIIKGTIGRTNKVDGAVALSMALWKASQSRGIITKRTSTSSRLLK